MSRDELIAEVDRLTEELADLQLTLGLIHAADIRAIKMWQKAHPGTGIKEPGRAKLVSYLLGELDKYKAVVSKAQYALQQVEWGYDHNSYCPYCGELPSDGHHVTCELKAALEAIEEGEHE